MKKSLLTTVARVFALAVVLGTATPAVANYSYYSYAQGLTGSSQVSFAKSMVHNYERAVKNFAPLVEKYGHYPWAKAIVKQFEWYKAEVARFQLLAGITADTVKPVETHKSYTYNYFTQQKAAPETAQRTETVVEETIDYTVNVYLDVTIVYTSVVTYKDQKGIFTTTHFSDDSTVTSVSTELQATRTENTTRKVEEREFVRTYELERPVIVVEEVVVETQLDGMGIKTANVLTVDEYLARDDVNYAGTQAYSDAVHNMNSRINQDYINRSLSLSANNLSAINAPTAWARGWTGKGSTLAILDTGIDIDHAEFEGRILASKCFLRACNAEYDGEAWQETIQDENKYSHGTHVAGIAAAALDGVGTTGVAYDANLLIGKVATNSGYYDMSVLGKGIEWAVNNGADAINVSGNYNVDRTYKKSIVSTNEAGVFRSTDTRSQYATQGYSNLMTDTSYMLPSIVNSMSGNEAVVVMAAGNQRLATPTFPAHYAIAENEAGELLLGGKVIVVGSWDTRLDAIATASNKAGTMCFSFNEAGACNSNRRISDWYIMAPGQYVASTDKNGEYRTNSGTSMAAPAVTGAVGIIHQMWPYMKGENIVKLLLNTADKNLTNYDVNVHGQGLLDLDNATTPQGAIGIPTSGRIEGARSNVGSGAFAMSGGAHIASISSLMVVDDYDRNFFMDGNSMLTTADTRTADPTQAAVAGFAPDYYFGLGGGHIINTEAVAVNVDDASISLATTVDNFMFGMVAEDGSFLGNVASNPLMDVTGATTVYAGYNVNYDLGKNTQLFGNATMGITKLNVGNSLMESASNLISNSATLGIKQQAENGDYGFVASVPVAITNGNATFTTPSTVSATGDVEYMSSDSSLSATKREVDIGLFRNFSIAENVTVKTHVEARLNYAGTDNTVTTAGVNLKWRF